MCVAIVRRAAWFGHARDKTFASHEPTTSPRTPPPSPDRRAHALCGARQHQAKFWTWSLSSGFGLKGSNAESASVGLQAFAGFGRFGTGPTANFAMLLAPCKQVTMKKDPT